MGIRLGGGGGGGGGRRGGESPWRGGGGGGGVRDVNEGGESTLARSGPGRISLRWTGGIFYTRTCIDGKSHSRPCIYTLLRSGRGTLDPSARLPAQGYLQVSRQSGNENIALLPSQRIALKLKKCLLTFSLHNPPFYSPCYSQVTWSFLESPQASKPSCTSSPPSLYAAIRLVKS